MTSNVLSPACEKVQKPWGWYQDSLRSLDCVMKIIHVNPGAKLSLQSHQGRSEVWAVRTGTATVVLGADTNNLQTHTLHEGESIKIPLEWAHRLQNDTNEPLEVAEIQLGRCEETDIIRYEDDYKREGTND